MVGHQTIDYTNVILVTDQNRTVVNADVKYV